MGLARKTLLWCSQNEWMKTNVPKFSFVKKAVKKFMPGESLDDAINAAEDFNSKDINTLFTRLGENISNLEEAKRVRDHYAKVLDEINAKK